MNFKIEANITIPKNGSGRPAIYPWRQMNVGDSFIINKVYTRENMQKAGNSARNFCNKANLEWRFSCRKENNQIRIYRTK